MIDIAKDRMAAVPKAEVAAVFGYPLTRHGLPARRTLHRTPIADKRGGGQFAHPPS